MLALVLRTAAVAELLSWLLAPAGQRRRDASTTRVTYIYTFIEIYHHTILLFSKCNVFAKNYLAGHATCTVYRKTSEGENFRVSESTAKVFSANFVGGDHLYGKTNNPRKFSLHNQFSPSNVSRYTVYQLCIYIPPCEAVGGGTRGGVEPLRGDLQDDLQGRGTPWAGAVPPSWGGLPWQWGDPSLASSLGLGMEVSS